MHIPSSKSDWYPLPLTHTHRSSFRHGYHCQHSLLSKGMKLDKIPAYTNTNCKCRIISLSKKIPAGHAEMVPTDHWSARYVPAAKLGKQSMCFVSDSVPETIPRHGSVENKHITTHLKERAPALVAGLLLRRALLRLHRDRQYQSTWSQWFTKSNEHVNNFLTLWIREKRFWKTRGTTPRSVWSEPLSTMAPRGPHMVYVLPVPL